MRIENRIGGAVLSARGKNAAVHTFAQVVNIRQKKAKNQKLDKSEQEFYKRNKHLVDFKRTYTEQDEDVISKWT